MPEKFKEPMLGEIMMNLVTLPSDQIELVQVITEKLRDADDGQEWYELLKLTVIKEIERRNYQAIDELMSEGM